MDREQLKALAISLCEKAKCSEKQRKIHFDQLVKHGWNPHPPATFIDWWKSHPEHNSISPARAFNCLRYTEEFNAAPHHVLD